MNAFIDHQEKLRVTQVISSIVGAVFVLLLVLTVAWMQYGNDDPPFVSLRARMLDSNGTERYAYRPGEVVQIRRDFCAQRTVPVEVGRMMRNIETEAGILFDTSSQMYRSGCREGGNIIVIPPYAPFGKYAYVVTVRYPENFLRDTVVELPVVFFEVVK